MTGQRRKEAYEALHPETKHETFKGNQHTGSRQLGDNQIARFTADTAARIGQITEISLIGGNAQPGGPHCAMTMMRTWWRAEGEGVEAFKARVKAEAVAMGADSITWAGAPMQEPA